ncbi:MAG: TIGR01906 family membrane protein [Anaerolineaceae bacterium]|nr:MAG: TIGR01906 family membrane protein [Anaerolineaceae bacterium]
MDSSTRWQSITYWILQILIPVILILSSVWIMLNTAKWWVQIEYRLPGFPEDRYGFTLEDRLYWSAIDIDFLLNDEELDYFDDFHLEDGSPMHNQRELRHMDDVKRLIHVIWYVLGFGLILVLLLELSLVLYADPSVALEALRRGARNTLILVGLLILGVIVSFGILFVGFHRIFFEGDTWIFLFSDTFIRLYPERFWRDTFIFLALLTALVTVVVYLLSNILLRRLRH